MRKIGINLNAYSGLEDNTSLKTIKNIGFDSFFTGTLDLKSQFKIAETAALNNISYEFVHGPFGHINDIWLDCAAGDEMQNEISVWKRILFITPTVVLAFAVGYVFFTGGAIG